MKYGLICAAAVCAVFFIGCGGKEPAETYRFNIPEEEYNALRDIYESTDGSHWAANENWLDAEDCGTWRGVTVVDGSVVKIELDENNLTGGLPESVANLKNLRELDFRNNKLTSLPDALGSAENLREINVSHNELTELDLSHNLNLSAS